MIQQFLAYHRSVEVNWYGSDAFERSHRLDDTSEASSIPGRDFSTRRRSAVKSVISNGIGAVSVTMKDEAIIILEGSRAVKDWTLGASARAEF